MNLLKALATVSGLTFISRVLGLARDSIITIFFGATAATDAFVVAFRLPNLLRRLFAEGAFSQAFVPVLAEYKNKRGEAETKLLIDHVATTLAIILLVATVIGMIGAAVIIYLTAYGFVGDQEKFDLTVTMLRITFPYIFFISLTALAGGILNTWNRFAIPAFTPTLLNVAFIAAALLFRDYFDPPILVLAWAVFAGGLLQLLLQIPALMRIGMLPRLRFGWGDPGVRRILLLMGPALLGVSVGQISIVLNQLFASFLPTGSITWLYCADRLMEFPTGLLGVALGTILLPTLAKYHSEARESDYSALLDWGLRLTLMLTLPAALALALLATPLIASLFQYGQFSATDLAMTRTALIAYSVGLLGLIMVKILAPGFYARQNIKTPVKIAIVTLIATQLMNLAFIGWLQHAGLALSVGLGACLNAALLFILLKRRGIYMPQPGWARFTLKLVAALALMGLALWTINRPDSWWVAASWHQRVPMLGALVIGGMAVYFSSLWLLGFRIRDFVRRTA